MKILCQVFFADKMAKVADKINMIGDMMRNHCRSHWLIYEMNFQRNKLLHSTEKWDSQTISSISYKWKVLKNGSYNKNISNRTRGKHYWRIDYWQPEKSISHI